METEFKEIDESNTWNMVYQHIRQESCGYEYTCKDARKLENKNLNRYRDVNPYDHTRVRLQRGDKDYINASLVEVPQASRSYILTQGPLPSTVGHFWLMVWEQKSKGILMLNRVIEKNTVKCHQYWPLGTKNGGQDEMILNDVGLKVFYIDEREIDNYTVRNLKLLDVESGEEREILQFHYTTWPDFGVPESPSAFLKFLMAVRKSGALSKDVGPAIVHCSAGIGRSGTFCLVDSCLVLIEATGNANCVNVREVLLEMRKYRMGLIQTADQLRFSYMAIIEGAKSILVTKKNEYQQVPLNNSQHLPESTKNSEENGLPNEGDENLNFADNGLTLTDSNSSERIEEDRDSESLDEESETTPPPLPPRIGRPQETTSNSSSPDTIKTIEEAFTGENCRLNDSANHNGASQSEKIVETSDRERELELRKRRRRDKTEQTSQLVQRMRQKQRDSETSTRRRLLFKKLSLGVVLLMSTGIIVYRYYVKE